MKNKNLPDNAIEIKGLSKKYNGIGGAKDLLALDSIDLEIPRGSMFGLLGPNGAGKSTFINILAGLTLKTNGKAIVWGFDLDETQDLFAHHLVLFLKKYMSIHFFHQEKPYINKLECMEFFQRIVTLIFF